MKDKIAAFEKSRNEFRELAFAAVLMALLIVSII